MHACICYHLTLTYSLSLLSQRLTLTMVITTVPELAQAINRAGGGKGGRWWLKRKDENACVIGLYDSEPEAGEVVFSRELWGVQPPGMYLQKLGDWSDVDYDVATDVIIYCQESKITFGRA